MYFLQIDGVLSSLKEPIIRDSSSFNYKAV